MTKVDMSKVVSVGMMPGETKISKILEQGLVREYRPHRHNKRLFAGDAAACPRRAVLFHNIPEETVKTNKASSQFYFKIGDAIHEVICAGLNHNGHLMYEEYRLAENVANLGGRVDAIAILSNKLKGLEFKSCGKVPTKIKSAHRWQALTYSFFTGLPFGVLYFSRNVANWSGKLETNLIMLDASDDEIKEAGRRVIEASVFTNNQILPEIPSNKKSASACRYCPFVDGCWNSGTHPGDYKVLESSGMDKLRAEIDEKLEQAWSERPQRLVDMLAYVSENGTPSAFEQLEPATWNELLDDEMRELVESL